jgi:hypothetical protein
VLADGGTLCFTIPIVVGRFTRHRTEDEPPSFHGARDEPAFLVVSEYGSDAWTQVAEAGFDSVTMTLLDYPAGIAMSARKIPQPVSAAARHRVMRALRPASLRHRARRTLSIAARRLHGAVQRKEM